MKMYRNKETIHKNIYSSQKETHQDMCILFVLSFSLSTDYTGNSLKTFILYKSQWYKQSAVYAL